MFKSNFKKNFKSMTWNDPWPVISEGWLGGLALSHVYRLTLVRRAKSTIVRYISTFVWYISRWLTTGTVVWLSVGAQNTKHNTHRHNNQQDEPCQLKCDWWCSYFDTTDEYCTIFPVIIFPSRNWCVCILTRQTVIWYLFQPSVRRLYLFLGGSYFFLVVQKT